MSTQNEYKFSELLIQFRERKGLTKTELAKRLGVSLTSVIRYEDPNEAKKPNIKNLARLCSILELTPDEKDLLFQKAILTDADAQQVDLMLKNLLSPMFEENIVDIITKKEMMDALGMLSKMDEKQRDQALKSIVAVVKGFS